MQAVIMISILRKKSGILIGSMKLHQQKKLFYLVLALSMIILTVIIMVFLTNFQ